VNGVWVPWNGWWNGQGQLDGYGDPTYPDGPERFRDAYRHIVDLFRAEGATNVTWFFHAQTQRFFPQDEWWNDVKYYYPGDDYVDWIGLSNCGPIDPNDPHFISFDDKLASSGLYDTLTAISQRPLAIVESAIVENARWDKAQWIKDAFQAVEQHCPRIRGMSWWDAGLPGPQDMRINSSPAALDAFRAAAADPYFQARAQFSGDCSPMTPAKLSAHRRETVSRSGGPARSTPPATRSGGAAYRSARRARPNISTRSRGVTRPMPTQSGQPTLPDQVPLAPASSHAAPEQKRPLHQGSVACSLPGPLSDTDWRGNATQYLPENSRKRRVVHSSVHRRGASLPHRLRCTTCAACVGCSFPSGGARYARRSTKG
jgi:hypothetical protein